jgi:site-specific DNA recombinase
MESETLISLLATLAQAESESISGNVKWGVRKGFKQGKALVHYNNLLGYEKGEDGNPTIIPDEAEVVRFIFNSYLSGNSVANIKRDLEERGIKTATGKTNWSIAPIQHILRNEKYVGDILMQKTYTTDCISKKVKKNNGELPKYLVKNNHEAIIDRVTFNRVQKEIIRRISKRKVSDKAKTQVAKYSSKYALSELLVCGKCGTPYKRVTWSRNGKKKIVWRCISRLDYGAKYCPDSPTMEEEKLHTMILGAINELFDGKEYLLDVLKGNMQIAMHGAQPKEDNPLIIESQIKEYDNRLKQLIKLSASTDSEKRSDYYLEIASIGKRMDELKTKQKTCNMDADIGDAANSLCNAIGTLPNGIAEFDDNVVRQLIDVIRVVDKDRITVVFKGGTDAPCRSVKKEVL